MRGPDTFTKVLFTMRRLDDFVPANHPLRRIRVMINESLAKMDELFSRMYEADIKGDRSIVYTKANGELFPSSIARHMDPR